MSQKSGQLHSSWQAVIGDELEKPYMQDLRDFLKAEKAAGKVIYPPSPLIFNAFNHTPFDKVRVVIIGQDDNGKPHSQVFFQSPFKRVCEKFSKAHHNQKRIGESYERTS